MPAAIECSAMLPGLSSVAGKPIVARFDAADGGLLALREIERRIGLAQCLSGCILDRGLPERVRHGLDEIIRLRMLMIAAGYEDGNDADALRGDPMFKLAMERLPAHADLCSQSTLSRIENAPDARALLRIGRAMVDHYCQSVRHIPRRIMLDIDDTSDAVHGGQQLRLFNAHYDDYGFQPIVVFDGDGRMIAAVLRPGCRPDGRQIVKCLRRLVAALRQNWPRIEIMLRADGHFCTPEVLRFCRAGKLDYTLGVASTTTLRKHITTLEQSTAERAVGGGGAKNASLQGILRLRRKLGAHRGWAGGRGYTLHRQQSRGPVRPHHLPGHLLRAWSGGKPYRGVEDPSGRRSHLMLPCQRQSDAPVPPCRRLLVDVEPPRDDAAPFGLAHRAIRYTATTPDQARCQDRRVETADTAVPASDNAGPVGLPSRLPAWSA